VDAVLAQFGRGRTAAAGKYRRYMGEPAEAPYEQSETPEIHRRTTDPTTRAGIQGADFSASPENVTVVRNPFLMKRIPPTPSIETAERAGP
jgi:hypothetical protein